jgi:2'-5' RNA ligase
MANFFIEFRFHGYAQNYLKELIFEVSREFKVRGAVKERPVPHMALFYGASGYFDIKKVCTVVEKVGKNYSLVPFKLDGFKWKNSEHGKVITTSIDASSELKKLRKELAKGLSKVCVAHQFDTQINFWFHTTIAFKDIDKKFEDIWEYVKKKEKPSINQQLLRITVLNENRIIIGEYDLILQRWLSRREALSKITWQKTINRLKELRG